MLSYLEVFKQDKENEREEKLYLSYQTAYLTAAFVGYSMSGKQFPTFYEIYPSLNKEAGKQELDFHKEAFMQYAQKWNEERRK